MHNKIKKNCKKISNSGMYVTNCNRMEEFEEFNSMNKNHFSDLCKCSCFKFVEINSRR